MSKASSESNGRQEIRALLAVLTTAVEDAMDQYDIAGIPIPSLADIANESKKDFSPVSLRKAIRTVEGACEQIRSTLAPPAHTMLNRAMGMDTYALGIVIKHKVADVLLQYPKGVHANELSKLVKIESDRLARVMRMLATKHCFVEVSESVFANNVLSMTLVSSSSEACIMSVYTNECMRASSQLVYVWNTPEWAKSNDSKRSAFAYSVKDEIENVNLFDWFKLHPENGKRFNTAMIGFGNASGGLASIEAYPWENLPEGTTLCDVGSGLGAFSLPLSKAHPHLRITLQDLEGPMEHAKTLWKEEHPAYVEAGKASFVPIDFMKEAPVSGQDIYYLRFILHMWSDAEGLVVLKNVRKAMAPHSRLFIHDYVLKTACATKGNEEGPSMDSSPYPMLTNFGGGSSRGYVQDFNMMALFNAKERMLSNWRKLGSDAGLEITKVWDLGELGVIEYQIKN